MSGNDSWKQQLAFTSGTVLLWALLLMKLLPIAAAMQIPDRIQFVDDSGYADAAWPVFSLLTLFGALGITDFLLAVAHIGSRGLWLASTTGGEKPEGGLDRFCQSTFVSVFSIAKYATLSLFGFLFFVAVVALQHGTYRLFSVKSHFWGLVFYAVSVLAVLLVPVSLLIWVERVGPLNRVLICFLDPFFPAVKRGFEGFRYFLPVLMLFFIIGNATFFLSYKAELNVSKTIYDKTTSAAEVQVQLGGMTSNVAKMRLSLADSNGGRHALDVSYLGEGNYVARIDLSGLSPGRYGIILEYPYIDVSLVPLRLDYNLRREKWFVVADK